MPQCEVGSNPEVAAASKRARGPSWLRRRSIGKLARSSGQQMPTSEELMQRLGQEACMDGHRGCVNCLEWNGRGDLLASGSDDSDVIIWDVFRRRKANVIKTGHEGTIFSVKFMPNSGDSLVATCAGDGQVKVTSIYQNEQLFNCNLCHTDRVKRLAVHPGEPNMIWSAAEDGHILEYDTRIKHVCNGSRPSNILVDLRSIPNCLQAKCIAVNPLRSEMLAVGSNDIYCRLYDRRYIKTVGAMKNNYNNNNNNNISDNSSCATYFAPGHLMKSHNRSNHIQTFGVTYLTFNARGTELLASYHAEQVYLFDINEPRERYKSFEQTIKPLLLDGHKRRRYGAPGTTNIQDQKPPSERNFTNIQLSEVLGQIRTANEQISSAYTWPALYCHRSEALMGRSWRGDRYQAVRDCCDALALDPMDMETIRQLLMVLLRVDETDSAEVLMRFLRQNQEIYPDQCRLRATLDLVEERRRELVTRRNGDGRSRTSSPPLPPSPQSALSQLFAAQPHSGGDFTTTVMDLKTVSDRYGEQLASETRRAAGAYDYSERYCGHCNMNTDIKEANFFGPNDEFIVGGSDDGAFYIWNKDTANIVKAVHADHHILNCVQPHPSICMLATSGIESTVKFWSPLGSVRRDVKTLDVRCAQNQQIIKTDPLEAMIRMLYPSDTSDGDLN